MLAKDEIRNWVIYKITSPNMRVYIGKTQNLSRRKYAYADTSDKSGRMVVRSIKKYGFNNHKMEVIDTFTGNLNMANDKEMFWIRTYMSNINKYPEMRGMNLTDGGEGIVGFNFSESARVKMSLAKIGKVTWNKGISMSKETRLKLSNINSGKAAHNKGIKATIVQIEKCRESKILAKGVGVLQYDINGNFIKEYRAIREASRETNVPLTTIINSLNGRKSKSGFIFKYKQGIRVDKFTFQRRVFQPQDIKQKIA